MHKVGLIMYILLYVDDILLTGNDQRDVHSIIEALSQRFFTKGLRTSSLLSWNLGDSLFCWS